MNDDIYERVAILETKVVNFDTTQQTILLKLNSIEESLTKYRGFVGGVAFILSGMWAFVLFAKDWLINHIK